MKRICIFLLLFSSLCAHLARAQNTEGTDFWLTFGENYLHTLNSILNATEPDYDLEKLSLQIRIVSGEFPTSGKIYFTDLNICEPFDMGAQEVFTYTLPDFVYKNAVYNNQEGVSYRTIHITSDNHPITVYALNQTNVSTDATAILPVPVLGTNYYQISYIPREGLQGNPSANDAYAVIATKDNTKVYSNGTPLVTLNTGEVYYKISEFDMTGVHITADKPVALFSLNQGVRMPADSLTYSGDCFMQQLASINRWGKNFFVPVSDLTSEWSTDTKDRVRIVASQNNTTVKQTGGDLTDESGGESGYTLNAGQFIELEVFLNRNGCYIEANKPVGVCTYLTSSTYNNDPPKGEGVSFSDPSQAWLPSIEQTITKALIAPFIPPPGLSQLDAHYALIITPTATKNETKVAIGGGTPGALNGGKWRDNHTAGWSFYSYPMTNSTESYTFTNNKGFFIMGYGTGYAESYYYLAFSAMRNLNAEFYVNDIFYKDVPLNPFCTNDITFRAEIIDLKQEPGSLKWYIDGVEETEAQDKLIWDKYLPIGEYKVEMWVRYADDDTVTLETTLYIGAAITAIASPPQGGTVTGAGCYFEGSQATLTATPIGLYEFVNWKEADTVVSTNSTFTFTVSHNRDFMARFSKDDLTVTIDVNDSDYGYATGEGDYEKYSTVTVEAFVNDCYRFANWTKDGEEVSTDSKYVFTITENINLTANFYALDFDTYSPTLWCNTFLLNLRKLREDGYEYTGCLWYKNGIEEPDTRTINEFSYSAGPYEGDLLEFAPTYYMFELITKNFGNLCSTKKRIDSCTFHKGLMAYPNPVWAGNQLTLAGFTPNMPIYIYNQYGTCVGSTVSAENTTTLTLNYPPGIYLIRSNNKTTKIVIVK